jgi:hypothetical protein
VQEELEQALERIKVAEQERDAFKMLAKNEEDVARIAAEGQLPLPKCEDGDDEFASPRKARVSLSTVEIVSSAASEAEIEELGRQVMWERQKADRALEMVEFLQAECQLRCCPCAKESKRATVVLASPIRKRRDTIEIVDPSDLVILREPQEYQPEAHTKAAVEVDVQVEIEIAAPAQRPEEVQEREVTPELSRRSTIFCPREGVFRTVSQQEAEALELETAMEAAKVAHDVLEAEPPTPVEPNINPRRYARTPSVEPPTFALLAQERLSLVSLLNAPHQNSHNPPLPNNFIVPVTPDCDLVNNNHHSHNHDPEPESEPELETTQAADEQEPEPEPEPELEEPIQEPTPTQTQLPLQMSTPDEQTTRPHTSAAFYTVTTTTTVPLRGDDLRSASQRGERERGRGAAMRTPSGSSNSSSKIANSATASFDINNPAMTPTMTREQALAQIRERRGRARSVAQGTATPRKQMTEGAGPRRDISAPTANRSRVRS